MRYVRIVFYLLVVIVLTALAVANRDVVTVYTGPDMTDYGLPPVQAYDLPLFALPLGGLAVGFILGVIWEFLREGATRRKLRLAAKEAEARAQEAEKRAGPAPKTEADEDLKAIAPA
ncbi:MAG: hypothetical protein EA355_11060 [Rhodobacteraceae bacterium]|nr:MAG: hypothetical protein EA355_11060 [Paracoccaceae bacterium]